ncbi:MAG: site-specific integrase [Sphingobium sp.]|nr:site-specific integrase [Sphingobium sp.]
MPKMKLTAPFCTIADCDADRKRTDFYDTGITGFVLECHQSGHKSYTFRYHDETGRQRQTKIGNYTDVTFDQAKRKAKELRSSVTLGGDPVAVKQEKKAVPLYSQLAEQHLAHARTYQKTPANTESILRLHLLPRWGRMRLTDIKTQDIALWLAEKDMAPATIEKIRITFNRSFELAAKWGMAGSEVNPVKAVPRKRYSNARERFLTAKEVERLKGALEASGNTQLRFIVPLLLLTGARKTELLTARWEHIDMERRSWLIPTSKTGKHRYVPLSQPAVDIITALPRFKDCPWLLPNPDTHKPYTGIKRAWETARKAAGLPDVRVHDLRHSAASFMINAGVDLYAVGRILGHADHKSTMRYSHLANDTLLAAVEAGASRMNASVKAA